MASLQVRWYLYLAAILVSFSFAIDMQAFEGTRISNKDTGMVYLVLDAQLRYIPNPTTYNNLFANWDGITQYDNAIIAAMALGPNLPDGACLVDGGFGVFVIDQQSDGKLVKRYVTSPDAMSRYSFDWSKIVKQTPIVLVAVPNGQNINAA